MSHTHDHTHEHPHDHSDTHDHAHGHSHEHSHGDGHSHSHGHDHGPNSDSGPEMSTKEKLDVLLTHWVDHNDSHKDNFYSWAKKAEQAGLEKIASHLKQVGDLSEKVTEQLKRAQEELGG